MTQKCSGFTKKKALILVLGLGVLILLLIVLRAVFAPGTEFDLSTLDGREAFLNSLGWEIDRSTDAPAPNSTETRQVMHSAIFTRNFI